MKKVAIVGTVGIPAKYGGFETLVENITGDNCSADIEYTVYCSGRNYKKEERTVTYKGAILKYIPLRANGIQSILYDTISIIRALLICDTLLILGISGCIVLPIIRLFSMKKIIINIDGLEHRREKWGIKVQRFLKYSEKLAVRYADVIVADNKAIQDYVTSEYGKSSELIAYGGDHALCNIKNAENRVLNKHGIKSGNYSFSLCRIEPENNVHLILEAYAQSGESLVFVGNWKNSQYGRDLYEKYYVYENVQLLDPIYDLPTLNVLRANCKFYIHGHSAGGTNPSLVEAMFFEKPIFAFDCDYNRESTENKANYFINVEQLSKFSAADKDEFTFNVTSMIEIANRRYRWNIIAKQYENLY